MVYFTEEQITDIVSRYKAGQTLSEIGMFYNVSRPTIQKVVKNNYPAYTGKKRASIATSTQTKVCSKCSKDLPLSAFNIGNSLYGRRSFCRECEKAIQKTPEYVKRRREREVLRRQDPAYVAYRNRKDKIRRVSNEVSLKKYLLRSAKQRAAKKGLAFDITIEDIELPKTCPLLNIPLQTSLNSRTDNSYSLDRLDSSKGYIKGNVWVISSRANTIKNNATLEELQVLTANLKAKRT